MPTPRRLEVAPGVSPMSVYSEMLLMALESDEDGYGGVPDLVQHAVECRSALGRGGDAATRLARSLAYDVALVRLCQRLELDHPMLGDAAATTARRETEQMLAARLPSLAVAVRET